MSRGRGNYRGNKRSSDNQPRRAYVPEADIGLLTFPEEFQWISKDDTATLHSKLDWKEGPKRMDVEHETLFISQATLTALMNSMKALDRFKDWELRKGKKRSNPFEGVNNGNFCNRSALKMANMDSLFNNLFTSPTGEDNTADYSEDKKLTFADICGAPGGFVEYVLWRKNNNAKGYGITIKSGREDYTSKLKSLEDGSFNINYGVGDKNGDGDIFFNENILEFSRYVLQENNNEGVHFAMADGAYEPEFEENHYKDTVFQRLMLCQIATGILVVKEGGHFVTNMFEILTPFTASLVYMLYHCFKSICILKPVTSRPANSERFIIGKSKISDTSYITNYLLNVNIEMGRIYPGDKYSDSMIIELLSLDTILSDQKFVNYLTTSNEKIATAQIQFLKKLKIFAQNQELYDPSYVNLPAKCVAAWNLPKYHASDSSLL